MLINSLKPLEEITGGGMVALPQNWTIEPWLSAWSTAQIGVEPTGLRPYFMNSIMMAVPAVILSTVVGALNGYVLTKWRFRGRHSCSALAVFLLHPVPDRPDPDGAHSRHPADRGHDAGPDPGAFRLRDRVHDALFPQLLRGVPDRTGAGGTDRRGRVLPDLLAHHAAVFRAHHRRQLHLAVHQHLERLPVRRELRERGGCAR
jgi:hypothetical protein